MAEEGKEVLRVAPEITLELTKALVFKNTLPAFQNEVKAQLENLEQAVSAGVLDVDNAIKAHFALLGHVIVHGHVVFALDGFAKLIDEKVKEGETPVQAFEKAMSAFINGIAGVEEDVTQTTGTDVPTEGAGSENNTTGT